jgi:phosphoglycolate phosphatase-like HAD superfamily hydrolase
MLILFDIDGTLLHSLSAGIHAMSAAIRELHGAEADFARVEVHGRLDTLIWRDLGRIHGFATDDAAHARFKECYSGHLERRLAERNTVEAMPGAHELVDAVRAIEGVTSGLLTGNYERTGRLKVRHAGIDPDHFVVNAWGDDGPDRRSLVPVAMGRYRDRHGRAVDARDVTIIGDTPHDVDCAHAAGARVIAVATGKFGIDALREAGADLAVADLRDTASLARWIVRAGG